eukprot:3483107-Rhodomonas_salina.1
MRAWHREEAREDAKGEGARGRDRRSCGRERAHACEHTHTHPHAHARIHAGAYFGGRGAPDSNEEELRCFPKFSSHLCVRRTKEDESW